MSFKEILGNIFNAVKNEKKETEKRTADLQQKANTVFGTDTPTTSNKPNPFLKQNGELVNPQLNYQGLLDNPDISQTVKNYITQATGFLPIKTKKQTQTTQVNPTTTPSKPVNASNLASLDVATELPKLSANQISKIISKHFSRSTVISPSDAQGIYDAQQKSGMSALAILGIGALESGYGTSNIAKKKNNLWGWNATNANPGGDAKAFSPVSQGALEFANSFMKTYYNGYGAKSIHAAGTGDNPAGKGYAYFDNGAINPQWATSINSIMATLYNTAQN